VDKPHKRKFLGFSFMAGANPRRRISRQAQQRLKKKVRQKTHRAAGRNIKQTAAHLAPILRGWRGYYGFCQTPSTLKKMDEWIRRRLRCIIWKQWRGGHNRYKKLTGLGIGKSLAERTAASPHGPWRISRSPALHAALPVSFFDALGLPRLAPQ